MGSVRAVEPNPRGKGSAHAWIGFALALLVPVLVAGVWWWGTQTVDRYAVNGSYQNGYSAEIPENHGGGFGGNRGAGDADGSAQPPPPAGGMTGVQMAALPIWA